MNHPEPSELEGLVAETLALVEERGIAALDEACARHPELADALRRRVEWLIETDLVSCGAGGERDFPERLGDFRLIERIGQGGMGVVYRAEQVSLGREVALKLVRPDQLYFAGALDRFEHEVTTVAGLAHPGIVPVFAVGQENGVPFFAMEHVRGASLADVLEHLSGRASGGLDGADLLGALDELGADPDEEPSGLFDGPWPVVCARIVREVAEALEHARRRGVLHRDVKPSNVMVTRGGRVLLLDFGLSSSGGADVRRTRTGQLVGTPAYMAPEQLRGDRELDARTDVFALGVMLYELLALRLPFDARSSAARLAAAEQPPPSDLRRVDPRVPWELETVVQVAADPDPGRRYDTAGEVARDLDRVLANRPIDARRSSRLLRARRWVQRHPAAALGLFVIVVGPSLLAVQEARSSRALRRQGLELADANAKLGEALATSDSHLEHAYEAVELMLSRVAGRELKHMPGMDRVREMLLQDALRLHEELLAGRAGDVTQLEFLARTLTRTAELQTNLGRSDESFATLDRAAALLDAELERGPVPELSALRADVDEQYAALYKGDGRHEEAETHARAAIERFDALLLAAGDDARLRAECAHARLELAEILILARSLAEAREVLLVAIDALHELIESSSVGTVNRHALAEALHMMGDIPPTQIAGTDGHDAGEAAGWLRDALAVRREVLREEPRTPRLRLGLAETLTSLAVMLKATEDFDEAERRFREAIEVYEELVREYPGWPIYAAGLATCYYDLSLIVHQRRDLDERAALLERAYDLFSELDRGAERRTDTRRRLLFTAGHLGNACLRRGEVERGLELLEQLLELGLPIWRGDPGDVPLRMMLSWGAPYLAANCLEAGDAPRAVAAVRRSLELDPTPDELVSCAALLAEAIPVGRAAGVEVITLAEWSDEALTLLEDAVEHAAADPAVGARIAEPDFEPLAAEPRYVALLERLGSTR